MRAFVAILAAALVCPAAFAQEVSITASDSAQSVLGALSGREFFDAVVPLDAVEAVLIRTRQQ